MSPGRLGSLLRRGWLVSVVGYTVARLVVAWGALGSYGVNPVVFAVVDVATAWPYAVATSNVVASAWRGDTRRLLGWAAAALVLFLAPYAYLFAAGAAMPASVRTALAVMVVAIGAMVATGLVRRARRPVHAPMVVPC